MKTSSMLLLLIFKPHFRIFISYTHNILKLQDKPAPNCFVFLRGWPYSVKLSLFIVTLKSLIFVQKIGSLRTGVCSS